MEVRDDFQDPCMVCIIRSCCSEHCDSYYEFFTITTFESFNQKYSKEILDDLMSCRGISIEKNNNGQEKKRKEEKENKTIENSI